MTVKESARYRRLKERILKNPGAKEAYEKGRELAKAGVLGKTPRQVRKQKK